MVGHGNAGRLMMAIAMAALTACIACLPTALIYVAALSTKASVLLFPDYYAVGFYVAFVACLVAGPVTLLLFCIIGVPLWKLSLRLGWTSAWHYAAVGLLVSGLSAGTLMWFRFDPVDQEFAGPLIVFGGTSATLAFWLVARPDRDRVRRCDNGLASCAE